MPPRHRRRPDRALVKLESMYEYIGYADYIFLFGVLADVSVSLLIVGNLLVGFRT